MNWQQILSRTSAWPWTVVLLAATALLATLTWSRIERNYSVPSGHFDWSRRGHSDFHNGLYLPTRAFAAGENPWLPETAARYRASRAAPAYSPSLFMLNAPFAVAPLPVADWIWFGFNVLLIALLAWMGVRFSAGRASIPLVLALTCVILVSRPAHVTLFTGYFTLQLVAGYAIALHYARSHPVLSGAGMLVASAKPNFVLPLILLMTARRDFRAVFCGIAICGLFALGGVVWLARDSSIQEVISGFRQGQEALHDDPTELPENRWTRVDLGGMVARVLKAAPRDGFYLALMPLILAWPAVVLFRRSGPGAETGATGTSGMLIAIASLLSIHHHSYDCLLLVVPWIGFALFGDRVAPDLSARSRMAVTLLVAVPAVNYVSTLSFQQRLGLDPGGPLFVALTLINGICLLIAMLVLILAWRKGPSQEAVANPVQTAAS